MLEIGLTTMHVDKHFSDSEILAAYARHGIGYADYYFTRYEPRSPHVCESMQDVCAYYTALKAEADSLGIRFHQTHAPYPTFAKTKKQEAVIFEGLVKSIYAASILGAKGIVVHPKMPYRFHYGNVFRQTRKTKNVAFYRALLPYAEQYGIDIALENMYCRRRRDNRLIKTVCSTAEELLSFKKTLNHPRISVCLDIGHAHIIYKENWKEMVQKLNGHIGYIHFHDNDGYEDDHLLPGDRRMNPAAVIEALKQNGFTGILNLECHKAVTQNAKTNLDQNLARIAEKSRSLLVLYKETISNP